MKRGRIRDAELIEMIMRGDQEINKAIEYLLFKYADKIMGYLMKQNSSKEDAEDVLYEGLSIFVMNVRSGQFQGSSSINTYLIAICKRIWFKKFNKTVLHQKWEKSDSREIKSDFIDTNLTTELSEGLEILMDRLKDKCKEVLRLWSLNYNMEEIKNKLGYSTAQVVANKKNLCLKELRKQLVDNPKLKDLII